MKLMRYCVLVMLASSSLCYGFDNSFIKHAGLGLGKFSLGVICIYIAQTTLRQKAVDENEYDENASPEENAKAVKNILFDHYTGFSKDFGEIGFGVLFRSDVSSSWDMNYYLNSILGKLSLMGVSIWGTWNSMSSGYDSLKKAYKSFKKVSKINKTSEETKTTSDTQEIGLQNKEKEFVDYS